MIDLFSQIRMNNERLVKDTKTPPSFVSRDEKKALKRAKEAELAFRKSKGYEIDTFASRLKKLFKKN